ncbi:unnamed protein product [Spirodela intermedia]|uniref:EF-hand domain-containing protein n=1 Tax=Spirodela intermedia TaxID=51605 RepID=A0A7I8IWE9_SPIIN|nr:unnamed protein product [Spirodela intermedia]CAA6662101.1 unnamed protein product [Spirodela intermedia]
MKIFTNFFNSSPSSTHLQKKSANCKSKEGLRPHPTRCRPRRATPQSPAVPSASAPPPADPTFGHPSPSPRRLVRPHRAPSQDHEGGVGACAQAHKPSNFGALGSSTGGEGSVEEELKGAFRVFDSDGDGRISAEELLGVFLTLGDDGCTLEDCRRMIGGVTSRDDGFVCFDDFVRMMSGQIGL